MTTWTMDQISAVTGLCRQVALTLPEVHLQHDGAKEASLKRVFKELSAGAQTVGVEIHYEDMEISTVRSPEVEGAVSVSARWRPSTEVVELRGPHKADGTIIAVEGAPVRELVTEEYSDTTISPMRMVWTCSGWHEQERHWVYTPAKE